MKANVSLFACLLLSSLFVLHADTTWAQGPGGGGFIGRGGGGFGFNGGADLLRNDQVRKELELVDDQVQKLEKLGEEFRNQMREMFSGLRDLDESERRAKFEEIRGKMQTEGEAMQAKIDEILLPHQRDRLNQIRLQMQLRRSGTSGALSSDRVADALGLSDDQKTRLREVQEKVDRELREKVEQLREEGRNEILEVLTAEQRSKWQELVGDQFELQFDRSRVQGRFGNRPSTDNP